MPSFNFCELSNTKYHCFTKIFLPCVNHIWNQKLIWTQLLMWWSFCHYTASFKAKPKQRLQLFRLYIMVLSTIINIGNEHGLSIKCSAPCGCLDECNNVSGVHVNYARRCFTEPLYWVERFRSDIDLSRHAIISTFTENQHYILNVQ